MKGILAIIAVYWLWAAIITTPLVLTGCLPRAARINIGYETFDALDNHSSGKPDPILQQTVTDRLWNWITTDSTEGKKVGKQVL